ncbi:MAG: hypothetical protein NT004_13595 [Bacteroidetes bacterium]|nr:hypothetical protein [Bacteroidota bacterium]
MDSDTVNRENSYINDDESEIEKGLHIKELQNRILKKILEENDHDQKEILDNEFLE